jgi:tetratricopeptide (TPR) repeat protein
MDVNKTIKSAIENYQAGNLRQAENVCIEILSEQPNNIDALHFLGILYYQMRNYDFAVEYLEKALKINPNDPDAQYNIGLSFKEKGQLDKAIACYQKALQLNPNFANAQYNLGMVLQEKGDIDEAIPCYQKALQLNPNLSGVYYNLGIISQEKEQIDEAIIYYQKALQLNPNLSDAHNNLGLSLQEKGQLDEALAYYQKALQITPHDSKAYYNMGNTFIEKGHIDEAIACYQKALQLNPSYADAYTNLGNALQEKGKLDEAIACYQNALQVDPNFANAHWNMSLALLLSVNFKQGWKEYEWRWKTKDFKKHCGFHQPSNFLQPIWDGFDIAGLTILIYAEQGFGDIIQFIRYAPFVAQQGAKVIFECPKELKSLVQNVQGISQVIEYGEQIPQFDTHSPLLSLPLLFGTTLETIPARIPYISADSKFVEKWRDEIQYGNSKLKVGLVWSGNPKNIKFKYKSFPLETFTPVLKLKDITFYSLQKGEAAEQTKNLSEGLNIIDFTNEINNFSDTAALIETLDLIISVDTAVAHLAGAIGKTVWTLIPYKPDWRWMLNREDSPWYPTMRLFRQSSRGNWESVIAKVKKELLKLLG